MTPVFALWWSSMCILLFLLTSAPDLLIINAISIVACAASLRAGGPTRPRIPRHVLYASSAAVAFLVLVPWNACVVANRTESRLRPSLHGTHAVAAWWHSRALCLALWWHSHALCLALWWHSHALCLAL